MSEKNHAVLQAPPGAGKTTRIPLALLNSGLFEKKIIMLQPRRLAVRSASKRLAQHYGDQLGQTVGYRMRGEKQVSKKTRIEVVTEGVLIKMIQNDPELKNIDCIIFDEFHERSLNADLGLTFCLEIRSELRKDLGILIMSATLDAAPVAKLMGNAPVITSLGKSYDVHPYYLSKPWNFNINQKNNFIQAISDLIIRALQENEGSILAFLPGAGEIKQLQAFLKPKLPNDLDIRPLYGAMSFDEQQKAILPSQRRKLILATSIAETSLTIKDIRIVIDGGLTRRSRFDPSSGMSRLVTEKVTKAEATQRMGRAGRTNTGVCYKLWTKGEEGGLTPFPEPEILISDLSPLAMELAAWGVNNPENLPFLTHPKSLDFQTAQELLKNLGAINDKGNITELGQKISREPTHPRLARILIAGGLDANLVVALIESKDILGPLSYSQMAAIAYPDRIGLSRNQNRGQFLLSGGKGAFISASDPLASAKMIVALNLDGNKTESKLRIGIEILETEFMELFHEQIKFNRVCEWSKRELKVITSEQKTFRSLVLSKKKWTGCNPELIAEALLEGVNDIGLDVLPWTTNTKNFLDRANKLNRTSDYLPNCSLKLLSKKTHEWLLPHLVGLRSKEDLKKLNMIDIIKSLFSWKQIDYLNKNAPEFIQAPTGTKININYSEEQPKIKIRIQELFGLKIHPTIGENKEPLLIELLSPAMRIVQTTSNLPKFWLTSYSDVRRDMRGRYPRHHWPENPMNSEPTKRAKKQK